MLKFFSNFAIVILIIVLAASWYFGVYLPLKKSRFLILAIQRVDEVKSVDEFEDVFKSALGFYSPIGQSETIKHTVNTVFNILNQNNSAEVAAKLLDFSSQYAEPVLKSKKGDGLIQLFYVLGDLYRINAFKHKNSDYLNKAEMIYLEGLKLGPKRPQFLYGLLQIYIQKGDVKKANEITNLLLKYWPEDQEFKKFLKGESANISF